MANEKDKAVALKKASLGVTINSKRQAYESEEAFEAAVAEQRAVAEAEENKVFQEQAEANKQIEVKRKAAIAKYPELEGLV